MMEPDYSSHPPEAEKTVILELLDDESGGEK